VCVAFILQEVGLHRAPLFFHANIAMAMGRGRGLSAVHLALLVSLAGNLVSFTRFASPDLGGQDDSADRAVKVMPSSSSSSSGDSMNLTAPSSSFFPNKIPSWFLPNSSLWIPDIHPSMDGELQSPVFFRSPHDCAALCASQNTKSCAFWLHNFNSSRCEFFSHACFNVSFPLSWA